MARNTKKTDYANKTYEYEYSPATITANCILIDEPRVISKKGKTTSLVVKAAMHSRVYESDGNIREQSTFLDIRMMGFKADKFLESGLGKGSRVVVSGQLSANNWEDKDGNTRYGLAIKNADVALSLFDKNFEYAADERDDEDDYEEERPRKSRTRTRSRSRDVEDDVEDTDDEDILDDDDEDFEPAPKRTRRTRTRSTRKVVEDDDDDDLLGSEDDIV